MKLGRSLRRWADRRSTDRSRVSVRRRLEQLEDRALKALPDLAASLYNQAGDVSLAHDMERRALQYWGSAIDAYLLEERVPPVRAIAKKILRVRPASLRSLCTLTWTAIASGDLVQARMHLRGYVPRAYAEGRERIASRHLRRMAEIVDDSDFREWLGELLLEHGDEQLADHILGLAYNEPSTLAYRSGRLDAVSSAALVGPAPWAGDPN
jgi:hypothetical protein